MKMPCLRNKFLNTKSGIDRKVYNKQRNICVSLIRSEKSFFSNNAYQKKNPFKEGRKEIISEKKFTEDQAIVEVFNKFFIIVVPN